MLYLTITATIQSCPTNMNLIMESGQIVSPNYPENYPKSVTCSWIITVPIGYQVSLKIHSFEVIKIAYSIFIVLVSPRQENVIPIHK